MGQLEQELCEQAARLDAVFGASSVSGDGIELVEKNDRTGVLARLYEHTP